MIVESRINVTNLRALVDAAASLQDAGETEKAKEVLVSLANTILNELGDSKYKLETSHLFPNICLDPRALDITDKM